MAGLLFMDCRWWDSASSCCSADGHASKPASTHSMYPYALAYPGRTFQYLKWLQQIRNALTAFPRTELCVEAWLIHTTITNIIYGSWMDYYLMTRRPTTSHMYHYPQFCKPLGRHYLPLPAAFNSGAFLIG